MRKYKSSASLPIVHDIPIKSPSVQEVNKQKTLFQLKHIINQQYENRFLGEWEEQYYDVTRKYLTTENKMVKLYVSYFTPLKPQATIIIIHGFGEHSGRYIHLADEYARMDYQVVLYDQRGFGQSGAIRGHADIAEMHQDLETIMRSIERSQPIFLYCHSLGAAVGLSYCISNPTFNIQGLIAVNPYISVASKYTSLKLILLHILNQVLPGLMINSYIDYAHCSKNNYNIRNVAQDSLIIPFLSIKMAHNILRLTQFLLPNAHLFKQPILIIHGKEDKVASHMNSIELYRLVGSKEKTLKLFDNGFHELQNDIEFERLKNFVAGWCHKQVNKDKRISYIREMNHGIKDNSKIKFIILQLVFLYFVLKNHLRKFSFLARTLSIIALMIASLAIHLRG